MGENKMTEEQQQELDLILNKIKTEIEEYNSKAKAYGKFARVAYVHKDHTWNVEDLKADGKEITEDWVPENVYGYGYYVNEPGAAGWFPSMFCV